MMNLHDDRAGSVRGRYWPVLAAILLCPAPAVAARRPADGTLVLDLADPVVDVRIGDRALRLRVDLDQRNVVELNEDAAKTIDAAFRAGATDDVGRVPVPSRIAPAILTISGKDVPVNLSTHGACCEGVDGAIGPMLLPFAEIVFRRAAGGHAEANTRQHVMDHNDGQGLTLPVRTGAGTAQVQFSLSRADTLATAAAGAILAKDGGGRFIDGYASVPVAFGVSRPSRTVAFARPPLLAGFRFATLRTRTADYGGDHALPRDPAVAGDIVVKRSVRRQGAWPLVLIGRDRLAACDEIRFRAATRALSLTCRFDG